MLVRDEAGMRDVPGLHIVGRHSTPSAPATARSPVSPQPRRGQRYTEAATVGNCVAGVTVQKLFITGTASPEEIIAIGTDPDFVLHPELADDPRRRAFMGHGDRDRRSSLPTGTARVTHAIFDNDGTISTLREGWEAIMEPVMVTAMLGDAWKSADEKLFSDGAGHGCGDYIDTTTGVQTLVQMQGLVEMVKEFGIVPPPR